MHDSLVDAILGCLVGGAIGDAMGASFEGASAATASRAAADWQLTDDTQLTLATCEALIETATPDPALIAASFLRWFRARRLTGLGSSTLKALRDLDVGAHWAMAGSQGERSAGNGAAMRIAPLALCVNPPISGAESRRLIRDVSRITHHNDEAYLGALAVVLAIGAAIGTSQSRDSTLAWIASHLPDSSVRDRLLLYAALPENSSLADAAQTWGASGHVVESVPLALLAAGQTDRLGFAGMLEQLIDVGGDTDTNASIAGQVAGTLIGFDRLPTDLVDKLPQADMLLDIARDFAASIASRVASK